MFSYGDKPWLKLTEELSTFFSFFCSLLDASCLLDLCIHVHKSSKQVNVSCSYAWVLVREPQKHQIITSIKLLICQKIWSKSELDRINSVKFCQNLIQSNIITSCIQNWSYVHRHKLLHYKTPQKTSQTEKYKTICYVKLSSMTSLENILIKWHFKQHFSASVFKLWYMNDLKFVEGMEKGFLL